MSSPGWSNRSRDGYWRSDSPLTRSPTSVPQATSIAALWFFPRGQFVPGVLVIVLFVFSDLLDGTMARLSGRAGPWGNYLDSTLDRVADGAVFGADPDLLRHQG